MDGRNSSRELSLNIKQIAITKNQKQILQKHAQSCLPNESCAILYGASSEDTVKITDIFLTKNKEASPNFFTISEDELIEAYDKEKKSKPIYRL